LDILACPACKGDVEYDTKNESSYAWSAGKYPVRDGIPIMLVDESEAGRNSGAGRVEYYN
jgi:uncharacterized protein YbaR (Trm112 family)